MLKILSLLSTAPGVTREDFAAMWRDQYLPALLSSDDARDTVRRATHNLVKPGTIRDDQPQAQVEFAGIAEYWFDTGLHARRFFESSQAAAARRAMAPSIQTVADLLCTEVPMWRWPGEWRGPKAMMLFKRNPAMARHQAQRYWNVDHVAKGEELGLSKYLQRYVQNHVVESTDPGGRFDFDGCPELWFESPEQAALIFADANLLTELSADEAKFSNPPDTINLFVEEVHHFNV